MGEGGRDGLAALLELAPRDLRAVVSVVDLRKSGGAVEGAPVGCVEHLPPRCVPGVRHHELLDTARKGAVELHELSEAPPENREAQPGLRRPVCLVESVDEAASRGANVVLVQHPRHQIVAAQNHRALLLVLVVHGALDLACARHVERGHVVQQVVQQRADNLLARPAAQRFDHERRLRDDLVARQLQVHLKVRKREEDELHVLGACEEPVQLAELHGRDNVVLDQPAHGGAVGGDKVVVVVLDDDSRLRAPQLVLREMHVDLITVEVGVVGLAVGIVEPDHPLPLVHPHLMRHKRHLVQGRLAVDQHKVPVDQMPPHLPVDAPDIALLQALGEGRAEGRVLLREVDFVPALVHHVVGARPRVGPVDDSGAEPSRVVLVDRLRPRKLLREYLRNAHLVGVHKWIRGDHGAACKVDALAHHVHAHEPLLALEVLPHALDPRRGRPLRLC
mmetsp:Transcript_3040/g.7214  ORF Transcript_3040/g.7214 Transcript_3040/m.7214 type:complete len:448 (+) Transcript_3040:1493-2836(+)